MTLKLPLKISKRQLKEQAMQTLQESDMGIADYAVVCDESNNSQEDIDQSKLNVFIGDRNDEY